MKRLILIILIGVVMFGCGKVSDIPTDLTNELGNDVAISKVIDIPPVVTGNFTTPKDNKYLPRAIGHTYIYEVEDEEGLITNEITYTTENVVIMGVTCTVVLDIERIYVEDLATSFVLEETEDWYAWDNEGNVWYFGEATTENVYDDDWNYIGSNNEGQWKAGENGAKPGIVMLAKPRQGYSYQQEYAEDIAEDMGKVLRMNAKVSIDYGDFEDCLKTKEWTPLEPGEIEQKFYAPYVGLVYIKELKGKTVHVELVNIVPPLP